MSEETTALVEPEDKSLSPEFVPPPDHPMGALRLISISSFWFATNVHWTALLLIVIPHQVEIMSGRHQAQDLGLLLGLGSVFSLLMPLIVGPLSDRCISRWGRRGPYLTAGVAVNIVGLFAMLHYAVAGSFWGYLFGFTIVQLGNNLATGAYQGVIPDVVVPEQRGVASGYMGMMTQLGSALGAVVVGVYLIKNTSLTYLFLIACLAVFWLLTVVGLKEKPLTKRPPPITLMEFIKGLWIDPRKYPDFAWVWITRALVMLGFYTVQPFVLYYLRDIIHVQDPEKNASMMFLAILTAATVTGLLGGWLSDRVGRKVIVYIANGMMAVMAVCLVLCHTFSQALIVGVIFGLGYGAYISVDWALGTDVLPNKAEAGKDMAIWHIAMVLPQTIAFPIAGTLVSIFGYSVEHGQLKDTYHYTQAGYTTIFCVAAVALALGAVFLRNVRSAK